MAKKMAKAAKTAAKKAPSGAKSPAALAKKIQTNRARRAKAEAQIAALGQKIAGLDADLDAVVASALG